MKRETFFLAAVSGLGVCLVAGLIVSRKPAVAKAPRLKGPVATSPELAAADSQYSSHPAVAEKAYRAFVDKHQASKDAKVQTEVGSARLHLGYLAAHRGDWSAARSTFKTAELKYRGTEPKASEFGGIPDQAEYQADVCLMAEGKKDSAKTEFKKFIQERPLSPLCMACYRRLVRLNDGKPTQELDRLIQSAMDKQQANSRFEMSVCGPKDIEYLLGHKLIGSGQKQDYKALAKLCGTKDSGTSVSGMRDGLGKLGIHSWAYKLSRKDLARAPMPAILLTGDHYVVLLKVEPDRMRVYDSFRSSEIDLRLPHLDDPDFDIDAILFSPLAL